MQDIPNGFTGFTNMNGQSLNRNNVINAFDQGKPARQFSQEEVDAVLEQDRRWSWIEVDRAAIAHNVRATKSMLGTGTRLAAVVKADGYGHGAVEVANIALSSGATFLAVATVNEGIELRKAGITEPVLLLSEPPAEAAPLLLFYNIIPSVYTAGFAMAYAEAADLHGMKAPYHLAINTGMNRIGVRHNEVLEFVRQVSFHRALELQGCFTHFATADSLETLDFQIQIRRFVEAMRALEAAGIDPGIVHCDNSASIYRFPKTHFDMVRMGISMYGYQPAPDTHRFIELRPAMSVKARITSVITVPMSEGVGYGMTYRSPGSVQICTVPVGYADGLSRLLSNKIEFAYQDCPVRQVGNICMDQSMFEVDMRIRAGHKQLRPQVGDEVLIAGPHPVVDASIDTMARKASTISYEILTSFALRMPRIYV